MTDDSNKPGGAGDDDPLSALFDLDEEKVSSEKKTGSGDPFNQKTVTLSSESADNPNDKTEFLSQEDVASVAESSAPVSESKVEEPQSLDSLLDEAFSEDLVGNDATEVLTSYPSMMESDDQTILDEEVLPAANGSFLDEEGATELTTPEDNPFEDHENDKTLMLSKAAEEVMGGVSKANIKEEPSDPLVPELDLEADATELETPGFDPMEATLADSESTVQENERSPSTISLNDENTVSASATGVDPVDEALAAFVEGDKDFDLKVEDESASLLDEGLQNEPTHRAPSPPPVEKAELSSEVSEEDFADVFDPGPIQVAAANQGAGARVSKLPFKKITAIAASLLVVFGGLGGSYYLMRQDRGLLGYRIEGFSVVPAYRPPDAQTQQAFKKIFDQTQVAIRNNQIVQVEQSIDDLKGVLLKDERNFQAAAYLLESYGMLLKWKGVSGEYPKLFDKISNDIPVIAAKFETSQDYAPVHRAYAYRTWALGDPQKAYTELEEKLNQSRTPDEDIFLVLSEISLDNHNKEKAAHWFKKIKTIQSSRTRFLKARIEDDAKMVAQLKTENYIPAAVLYEVSQKLTIDNAQVAEVRAEKLLEQVKDYPFLTLQVRSRQGDVYNELGKNEKARAEWQEVLKFNPKSAETWRKLASSFERDNKWDDALLAYATAEKGGGLDKELQIRYAKLLTMRGKIVEALTVLDKAIGLHPKSPRLYYEKGKAQLSIYQEDAAKQSFLKALEVDSNYELANLSLGELALHQRLWTAAEAYFKKIKPSSSNYGLSLYHLGLLYSDKKSFGKAEDFLEKANQLKPSLGELYPKLVTLYLQNERDQKAKELVVRGENFISKDVYLNIAKAKVFNFQRQYEETYKILEPFLQSHDHVLEVYYVMANALINDGQNDRAMKLLNQLVAREVRDGELDYLRAKAIVREQSEGETLIGSIDLASKLMASALRKHPENAAYRVLAAEIARKNEDRFLAFEHVDSVLETQPKYAAAHLVKGDIYLDNGEFQTAIVSYNTGLANTRFKAAFYHRLAKAYKLNGATENAIRYYKKVIRLRSKDARAHLELGKLYNEAGKFPIALSHLKTAVNLNPRLSESFYYLGFINKEVGNIRVAIQNFEKFLDLEPGGVESSTVKDEIFFLKQGRSSQN